LLEDFSMAETAKLQWQAPILTKTDLFGSGSPVLEPYFAPATATAWAGGEEPDRSVSADKDKTGDDIQHPTLHFGNK
jgi:hypothetical protein